MILKRFVMLVSVCAVAVSAVMARDSGGLVAGDMNGDGMVDVLDLQRMVSKVLSGAHTCDARQFTGSRPVNVLDLQRSVAETKGAQHPPKTPPPAPVCKVCFFCYQSGWIFEPVELKAVSAEIAVEPPFSRVEPAEYIPIPRVTERYLFRLTPNAPPFFA